MKPLISLLLALGLAAGVASQAYAYENDNTPKYGSDVWNQIDRNSP